MSAKHSEPVRGLEVVTRQTPRVAQTFQGRFGRLFKDLPPALFAEDDLKNLADRMIAGFDPPKDGRDDEESGIPALYTYLGQFIDHDLTFDPEGSFQKQKDPDALLDYRTPAFDLDNVYGRGPGDQPYLYESDHKSFLLGDPLTLGHPTAHDLPRNSQGRALIGDPRNDENSIVSQLQGLFLQFHNRVVAQHRELEFANIQQIVRAHYQYVVLHDFLPRIVHAEVLNGLKTDGRYDRDKLIFDWKNPFMPVEFAVAAYRLGHSMVRPGYRLNDATLVPIFPLPVDKQPGFPEGLTGFRRVISDWGIDWGRFIDIDVRKYDDSDPDDKAGVRFRRLQFAYRIDTSLVDPLASLPMTVAGNLPVSLALRNLKRGVQLKLPSGQVIAKALDVPPLTSEAILLGQGVDGPQSPLPNIVSAGKVFEGNCPLWTYILAEAMQKKNIASVTIPVKERGVSVNTPQLGPVGGRIVAEVFLGLLFADEQSILNRNPEWIPKGSQKYTLRDFVQQALGVPGAPPI